MATPNRAKNYYQAEETPSEASKRTRDTSLVRVKG